MKKLLFALCFVLQLISCEKKTALPDFPITLYPTGKTTETGVRLFVKDGEIVEKEVIEKFLSEEKRFFEALTSFPSEYAIEFLSEKEALWGKDRRFALTVVKEQNLFKLCWDVKEGIVPVGGWGSSLTFPFFEKTESRSQAYFPAPWENFYDNSKSSQIRKHHIISTQDGYFLLPQIIAEGNYDNLQIFFVVYKISSYHRKGSEIVKSNVNALKISNQLQDMDKLSFQQDYMYGDAEVQVSDTIAVKEFSVEYKVK